MPASFEVRSSTGGYGVSVENGSLAQVLSRAGDNVFVVDACLAHLFDGAVASPILIEAEEVNKSLDRIPDLIIALRERGVTRGTTLIAVGGGIVQDVAAFVASIYMRGIDWIYVPTTLLSMVDSCIGGKSSINVGKYKNIVGGFHPPKQVIIDPGLAATLADAQMAAGLCEAAKICLCRSIDDFDRYLALNPDVKSGSESLAQIIDLSLRTKKHFIEVDEFDKGERLTLNFGHTFGHALESASDFAISHGIAVGLGMLAAIRLGERLGHDYSDIDHVSRFRDHIVGLVGTIDGIDAVVSGLSVDDAMDAFLSDKKHSRDALAVVIFNGSGHVERVALPRTPASTAQIVESFSALIADWRQSGRPARAGAADPRLAATN